MHIKQDISNWNIKIILEQRFNSSLGAGYPELQLDVFEKNASLPPPRVPPCALLKEGKERDSVY